MANCPTMLTGHLAHDILHTLADLNRGDKLLGISSLLNSGDAANKQSIKHPIGFAVLFITQVLSIHLIRHIILRTTGTLMVKSKTQDHHNDSSGHTRPGIFGLLRHAIASPRRLRRDLFLGLAYNTLYVLLHGLLSVFSSSLIWNFISHVTIGLLLVDLHLRWTYAIVSAELPAPAKIISLPSWNLVLPSLVYTLAYQLTAKLPAFIARTVAVHRQDNLGGIAFADTVVLATAFGLRMLMLYPAFAAYIYSEFKQSSTTGTVERNTGGQESSSGLGLDAYMKAVRLCFRKTAFWFGLLHLQMVFVLAVFEILITPVVYKVVF